MIENKIQVYIRTDKNNCITQIESDISSQYFDFKDTSLWTPIDQGNGDKYAHAQGMYFPKEKPLRDNNGLCNYKYIGGKILELSSIEKSTLFPVKDDIIKKQQDFNMEIMLELAKIKTKLGVE